MLLPKQKQDLLDNIVSDLATVTNLKAVVLGGSYATGSATEASDLDIGIYYLDKMPFNIDVIKSIAQKYSVDNKPAITGFYEWGPWVNGGAWIKTAAGKIDLLYKNIEQITNTISKAQSGFWENHFEQQPPYGFSSVIYLAETQNCIPLYDPYKIIEKLKLSLITYPPQLKQSILQQSLWSAEFTIWHADQFAARHDVYNTAGCITRAVKNIVSALFAINELYPMGDKRAIECLEKADIIPHRLREKVEAILSIEKTGLATGVKLLKVFWEEVVALVPETNTYQSFYHL